MKFRPEDFRLALEEARRVIKAMRPDEVPHNLRGTRSSSSRRLTPIEAQALFRELEKDVDFRQATLSAWDAAQRNSADPRTAASVLFLERSDNWELEARGHLTEMELGEARDEIRKLKKHESDAQVENRLLKTKLVSLRQGAEDEALRRTEEVKRDLTRSKEKIGELEKSLADRGREAEYWEGETNAAWDELTEADRRYDELRERYSSKARSMTVRPDGRSVAEIGFSRDPLEAARMLDQMVSFWEVGADTRPDQDHPDRRPLELPPGMDPKSAGAMQWIYYEAPRLILMVDGWNVAHYWNYHRKIPGKPDLGTVGFVTTKLDNLAEYSIGRHQVLFYLDSRHVSGLDPDWDNRFKSGRLTGFYVEDADDAIAREAAGRVGERVAVITSDIGLAERCRTHGAVIVASEALAEWMANSPV
ncbi:MAG: NYN domain-containing protein [bacterium]|nr:NYN domain-containing protein [bacterium]